MAAILLGFYRRKQKRQARVVAVQRRFLIPKKRTVKSERAGENLKCRICLKDDRTAVYIPIFSDDSNRAMADNIRKFGEVEISEEDDLPKTLCQNCHNLLQAAVLFRTQAQATDQRLRETVQEKESSPNDYDTVHDDVIDWGENYKVKKKKEIKCRNCKLVFNTAEEFLEHKKSGLHKKARLQCPECQQSVAFYYLPAHIARYHQPVQPLICDVCGRSFLLKASLKNHMMTHTDQLPFLCPECPYRGRFRTSLKLHMHKHTGAKPYACNQCPARYMNSSNLTKHKRTHRAPEHKCQQCDRGFYTTSKLNEHLRIDHTGIKEHECETCGKEFAYRKQLMKHTKKVHKRPLQRSGRLPVYLEIERRQALNLVSATTGPTAAINPGILVNKKP